MKLLLSFYTSHKQNMLLFLVLLAISLILFARILQFGLIYDDYFLLWTSRFHPGLYGVYWGHPSTVFEFFVLYKLFGINALAFNLFGIFLRALSSFLGYLFIADLTKSKKLGIIFSLLFVTSYIGLQATTWASAHVVFIDLSLILFVCYRYLIYLSIKTKINLLIFLVFLVGSLISDPGRTFPVIGFIIFLFLTYKSDHKLIDILKSKEFKTMLICCSITVIIFIGWYLLFGYYFGGGSGGHRIRVPFGSLKYFFGSIANLLLDPFLRTPEGFLGFLKSSKNVMSIYSLSSILLSALWVITLLKFIKRRSIYWTKLTQLFFWIFIFYIPSWISYPRIFVSAIHRYLTISGFGFIGILALIIFLISRKSKIFAVLAFFIIIAVNIATVDFYLTQEGEYRDEKTATRALNIMNTIIPKSEQQSLIYLTGDEPFVTLGILNSGGGPLAILKNQKNPENFINPTTNLEKIANELCHQGIDSSERLIKNQGSLKFHAFYIRNNGDVRDITVEKLSQLGKLFQNKNSCFYLKTRYGTKFSLY